MIEDHFIKLEHNFYFCSSSENFGKSHYLMEVIGGDTSFILGEILYLEHIFSHYLLNRYYLLGTGHLKMKRQTFLEGSSSAGGRSHENRQYHYSDDTRLGVIRSHPGI